MSLFENIKLTNNGLNLQSKAQVGKMLKFTNIKIGDGKIGSTPVSTITDLKNFKLTIELNKFKVLTDGQAVIGGILSNTSVTEGFYWREIGLYAEDPDTGLEILYAYGNCGDLAEFIPAVDSNTIIEKVVNIIILTSNMENVTASINNSLVYLSLDGDSSNTTVTFTKSEEKTDIESGDKLSVLFGKIKKWFSSFSKVAFSGNYNDLEGTPDNYDLPVATKDLLGGIKIGENLTVHEDGTVDAEASSSSLFFENVTVLSTDWVEDTTYEEFGYKADISCEGTTVDYFPEVVFSLAEAISGNYSPICSSGEGIVTIYAVDLPETDITIPTISCSEGA